MNARETATAPTPAADATTATGSTDTTGTGTANAATDTGSTDTTGTDTANAATTDTANAASHRDTFAPKLTTFDWNEEWMAMQARQHKADDAREWDKRAKDFATKHGSHSPYAERFIALADVRPGESVLDMGCGSGTLAIPLAQHGHRVIACDFSSGMLEQLRAGAQAQSARGISEVQLSWEDDWPSCGVSNRCVDVALASRSIATSNLKMALEKLSTAARRRACITLPCGPTPKVNMRLVEAAGLSYAVGREFLYAFNILCQLGYYPTVDYIPSTRVETFDTREAAAAHYTHLVQHAARKLASETALAQVPERLDTWLEDALMEENGSLRLREPLTVVWAFLSWDVNRSEH